MTTVDIPGIDKDRLYYILNVRNNNCKIYVAVDGNLSKMRKLISKEEAKALVSKIGEIEPLKLEDEKKPDAEYKEVLQKYDCVELLKLIKVSSESFINMLSEKGCKAVIFVEFVPVSENSEHLAPGDKDREYLKEEIMRLRREHEEMVFVSFPGDEKSSGGCIAAGRGFFHINSHGGAEPCPFSPYSDINVKDTSLKEAIKSRLFKELQNGGVLNDDHKGGCVLYEKRSQVEALL